MVNLLQIHAHMHHALCASVSDFIINGYWFIPDILNHKYLALYSLVSQVEIPLVSCDDKMVWTDSSTRQLSFKEAYQFLNPISNTIGWNKQIWLQHVPPSRSFLVWRLFHGRLPIDENLKLRGQVGVSMCSLCGMVEEILEHLFLQCDYARSFWLWLRGILQVSIDTSSVSNIFVSCSNSWSSQMRDVVNYALIHIFWNIWLSRNMLRFENKGIAILQAQNRVIAAVSNIANLSNGVTMFNVI